MAATSSIFKTLTRIRTAGGRTAAISSFPNRWVQSSSFCSSAPAAISDSLPTDSSRPQEKERGSRWSKWLLFVPGAITFGLGTWQIFRRQDKIKMLEYRQKRLAMEPLKFTHISPSSEQLDTLEFRRVACKGVFNEKASIFVGPRSRSISGVTENGYYVITPLMPIPNNHESWKLIIDNGG